MQIEVDMSYEQYFEASRLFQLHTTPKRRRNFYAGWYGYPVLGVVFAFLTVLMWKLEGRMSGTVLLSFGATCYFLYCRFSYGYRLRKLYDQQSSDFQGTMTLEATGLRYERKNGTANTDYMWSAFSGWVERPEVFLLFFGPMAFVRIPKDRLSSNEQDDVRGWITSSVKPAI